MRKQLQYLLIALLTFTIGVAVAYSYRLYQYQWGELAWREARLHHELFYTRSLIDQYAADKGELPQSLEDIVNAGYCRKVPYDFITDKREWRVVIAPDPATLNGSQGIIDVHSTSPAISSEGTPYSEW